MSRTDKDAPEWVRAMHSHRDGRRTEERHHWNCEHATGPLSRRGHTIERVDADEAAIEGWTIRYAVNATIVFACVPAPSPFACEIDQRDGRCSRHDLDLIRRRYWTDGPDAEELHDSYYAPERAAVRDSLRDLTKQHRAGGDLDDSAVPVRQHRHAMWRTGWWD